ncbi:MAG TPA: hypothetical protein VHQ20_01245, partial [Patescibacteria group bacterium]|nr:hypothetical protein [Patescibacteria group bacterium]
MSTDTSKSKSPFLIVIGTDFNPDRMGGEDQAYLELNSFNELKVSDVLPEGAGLSIILVDQKATENIPVASWMPGFREVLTPKVKLVGLSVHSVYREAMLENGCEYAIGPGEFRDNFITDLIFLVQMNLWYIKVGGAATPNASQGGHASDRDKKFNALIELSEKWEPR